MDCLKKKTLVIFYYIKNGILVKILEFLLRHSKDHLFTYHKIYYNFKATFYMTTWNMWANIISLTPATSLSYILNLKKGHALLLT